MDLEVTKIYMQSNSGKKVVYVKGKLGESPVNEAEESTRKIKFARAAFTLMESLWSDGYILWRPLYVDGFQSIKATTQSYSNGDMPSPEIANATFKGFSVSGPNGGWMCMNTRIPATTADFDPQQFSTFITNSGIKVQDRAGSFVDPTPGGGRLHVARRY